jgi:hypothetical protein
MTQGIPLRGDFWLHANKREKTHMAYTPEKLAEFRAAYEPALEDLMRKHPNHYKPGLTAKGITDKVIAELGFHGIWAITLTPATKAAAKKFGIANAYTTWEAWFND